MVQQYLLIIIRYERKSTLAELRKCVSTKREQEKIISIAGRFQLGPYHGQHAINVKKHKNWLLRLYQDFGLLGKQVPGKKLILVCP